MGKEVEGDIYLEHRMTDWLCQFFQSIGARFHRIPVAPGRDNVVAQFTNPDATTTVLLDAHQDTVPVVGMTIDPFEPSIIDGRVTGRGSADVKGGMAAMLVAFRRLVSERPAQAPNVLMSCTCDEESTATGIQALVEAWSDDRRSQSLPGPRPDAAIFAEPTGLDVVVAHRGVVRFKIHTRGRACHSSDPTKGENAIYKMARVIEWLEQHAARLSVDSTPHPLVGHPTLSVGRIEGGTSVNIVPEHCVIEVDRRLIPGESPHDVALQLEAAMRDALGAIAEFETPWLACHPLGDDSNGWLSERVLRSAEPVAGVHRAIGVPFGTNASFTGVEGIPSIVYGPGSIEQAHTCDESIEIEQLELAAEVYYRVCAEWGEYKN